MLSGSPSGFLEGLAVSWVILAGVPNHPTLPEPSEAVRGPRYHAPRMVRPNASSTGSFPSTMSAAFSAMAMTAALMLPRTIEGITDASATSNPSVPNTRRSEATTRPIAQVDVG